MRLVGRYSSRYQLETILHRRCRLLSRLGLILRIRLDIGFQSFMIAARVVTGDGELLGYTPQLARVKVLLFLMLMSRSIALQELVGLVERGLGRIRLVLLVLLLTLLLRSIPVLITGLGAHHLTGVSIPTSLRSRLIW